MTEPISILSNMYYTVWNFASGLKNALPRMRNTYQLRHLRCGFSGEPQIRINYGSLPSHSIVIGGAVKLLQLRRRFPNVEENFNLIYLVSSALPSYVLDFVRAAKSQGCKLVWNQNGVAYPAWCGDYYPWLNKNMRKLIHMADFVIYQSEFCKVSADRYLGKVEAPHVILFNPVDTEVFAPAEKPPDFSRCELLAMGTSHHFYRVLSSLETLSVLRKQLGVNAYLTIAGQFRWRGGNAQVKRAIRKKELTAYVRILPPFTQEEAVPIYKNAHILLHSKYKDPCPTVPIEAMAMGIPVIGSNSGGMPELVPPSVGILVNVPEDWTCDHAPEPHDLATAVVRIMSAYSAYSCQARQHALQTFDKNYWLRAHETIFNALLMGKLA